MVAIMASESAPSFDDLEPVTNDFDDDDGEQIQLAPGESVVGEIRQIHTGLGEYDSTLLYIARGLGDVVKLWSNRQIDAQMESADVGVGDVVGIRKTEETATYVDDDGEETVYNIFEVRSR